MTEATNHTTAKAIKGILALLAIFACFGFLIHSIPEVKSDPGIAKEYKSFRVGGH